MVDGRKIFGSTGWFIIKFDAQVDEMKYLRKSVRRMEDKVDPLPA